MYWIEILFARGHYYGTIICTEAEILDMAMILEGSDNVLEFVVEDGWLTHDFDAVKASGLEFKKWKVSL